MKRLHFRYQHFHSLPLLSLPVNYSGLCACMHVSVFVFMLIWRVFCSFFCFVACICLRVRIFCTLYTPSTAMFPLQFSTKIEANVINLDKLQVQNAGVKRTIRNSCKISSCEIYENYFCLSLCRFVSCQQWLLYTCCTHLFFVFNKSLEGVFSFQAHC